MNEGRNGADRDTLLIGIGNSGRSDDGLGWAFVDRIRQGSAFGGRVAYRYQLQVEDAALISEVEHVVFVDSYRGDLPDGFQLQHCQPASDFAYTSHELPPGAVLALCQALYGSVPRAELLAIQGTCWDLHVGLSPEAARRLDKALQFFAGGGRNMPCA